MASLEVIDLQIDKRYDQQVGSDEKEIASLLVRNAGGCNKFHIIYNGIVPSGLLLYTKLFVNNKLVASIDYDQFPGETISVVFNELVRDVRKCATVKIIASASVGNYPNDPTADQSLVKLPVTISYSSLTITGYRK